MTQSMAHSIRLGKVFSEQDITDTLEQLLHIESDHQLWSQHVNTKAFEGVWDVIALRCLKEHVNAHPIMQNFSHNSHDEQWQNLPLLETFPHIAQLVSSLDERDGISVKSVRLMRLHAGANILPHNDGELGLEFGEARLHVPITSDKQVTFYVLDQAVPMQVGELWYIDADKTHSVTNQSSRSRTHLVIDCKCTLSKFKELHEYIQSGAFFI